MQITRSTVAPSFYAQKSNQHKEIGNKKERKKNKTKQIFAFRATKQWNHEEESHRSRNTCGSSNENANWFFGHCKNRRKRKGDENDACKSNLLLHLPLLCAPFILGFTMFSCRCFSSTKFLATCQLLIRYS